MSRFNKPIQANKTKPIGITATTSYQSPHRPQSPHPFPSKRGVAPPKDAKDAKDATSYHFLIILKVCVLCVFVFFAISCCFYYRNLDNISHKKLRILLFLKIPKVLSVCSVCFCFLPFISYCFYCRNGETLGLCFPVFWGVCSVCFPTHFLVLCVFSCVFFLTNRFHCAIIDFSNIKRLLK